MHRVGGVGWGGGGRYKDAVLCAIATHASRLSQRRVEWPCAWGFTRPGCIAV
jgi:hypothetical protein